jgi:hypothetical protein
MINVIHDLIEKIDSMRLAGIYDDGMQIANILDLWEVCRRYLASFEVSMLESDEPDKMMIWNEERGELRDADAEDWNNHVRYCLQSMCAKYGFSDMTVTIKGVEYKMPTGGDQ